ncbi:hypothetical protein NQ117_08625 [Paenibacillus sp. SC116]|uniref:hypothetical protein n=1 Tax=Paenibacillus sp. SC116 TaxID=2968986 RepID=UPI00215A92F9|nr:hypothetical protein [Paenibacillus sp. SC116]MCR8843750.1 hypothetical protein [Paenibacillus sp. SC116]
MNHSLEFRSYWYGQGSVQLEKLVLVKVSDVTAKRSWSAPSLPSRTGTNEGDVRTARVNKDVSNTYLSYGPYANDMALGLWNISWKLKLDKPVNSTNAVVKIDVYDSATNTVLGERVITAREFYYAGATQSFDLKIAHANVSRNLEFRVFWYGEYDISFEQVTAAKLAAAPYNKRWEATDLAHSVGRAKQTNGSANTFEDEPGFLSYGPYENKLARGTYLAQWNLLIDNNSANNEEVVKLEVYDYDADEIIQSKIITRGQFAGANKYQQFDIKFNINHPSHRLELRTYWMDKAYIDLDWIKLDAIGLDADHGKLQLPTKKAFFYDAANRLQAIIFTNGSYRFFKYNQKGNLTKKGYVKV